MSYSNLYGAKSNTYANIFTFMGFPLSRDLNEQVDAVVMGIPYDLATSARAGTRYGPTGIRQASSQLRWEDKRWPWTFELADKLRVIDYGDIGFVDGNHAGMVASVMEEAGKIIEAGKILLSFGGDHYVSLPLIRAVTKRHGTLALLHFDAHTDTSAEGGDYDHGAMFHLADEEGLIDPSQSIQIGIRTEYNYDAHKFTVLDGPWANSHTADEIIERVRQTVGGMPVYLTFDIDCLDPAYAPGTGTPVAGGMTTDKVLQVIRGLTELNIVAMDIMEVAPAYDHAELTSLAAATLALEMLYTVAASK